MQTQAFCTSTKARSCRESLIMQRRCAQPMNGNRSTASIETATLAHARDTDESPSCGTRRTTCSCHLYLSPAACLRHWSPWPLKLQSAMGCCLDWSDRTRDAQQVKNNMECCTPERQSLSECPLRFPAMSSAARPDVNDVPPQAMHETRQASAERPADKFADRE